MSEIIHMYISIEHYTYMYFHWKNAVSGDKIGKHAFVVN